MSLARAAVRFRTRSLASSSSPVSPSVTRFRVPWQSRKPTTGSPLAIASAAALPKPSNTEGMPKMEAAAYSGHTSRLSPASSTRPSRPCSSASASSVSRSSPSPTIRSFHSG